MKTMARNALAAVALAIAIASQGWAQGAADFEEAGVAHFKKAYYEALPKKKNAEAGDEFRKAEAALRRAIAQAPDRVSARLHLGRTLFVQQKYQEAATAYGNALKIDPGHKPAYLQLASAREMGGDLPGAIDALEQLRSIEDDPQAVRMIDDLISKMRAKQ